MSELTGNWDEVEQDLKMLNHSLKHNVQIATAQNAEIVRKGLVKHIQNQDMGWDKLSEKYKLQKKKKGLSTAILIATSTLLQSITTKLSTDKLSAFVGLLRTGKRKDGEDPVLIGEIHEFGSKKRNIPSRPLFRPTLAERKNEVVKRYKDAVEKTFDNVGRS